MKISNKIKDNHMWFETKFDEVYNFSSRLLHGISYYREIDKREKEIIIEALLLKICALWESFMEKELILCINGDQSKIILFYDLKSIKKLDSYLLKALIFSNKYIKFSDIDSTKGLFKKLTTDSFNPTQEISKIQKSKIEFIYLIRNYLSHYSAYSKIKLMEAYKLNHNCKRFVEPSKFLINSQGRKFFELVQQFKFASINMKEHWN